MSCWRLTKFSFFPKTYTRTNTRLFCGTLPKTSTPMLVTRSLRLPAMKSSLSKSCQWTTKKSLYLMTWSVKATKTVSSIISSMGGTEIAALFTSLKPSTRCRKTSEITAAIFAFSGSFPVKTNGSPTRLASTMTLLDSATDKKFSFLCYDKPRKSVKKILMKIYNGVRQRRHWRNLASN